MGGQEDRDEQCGTKSPTPKLPAAPAPENDPGIVPTIKSPEVTAADIAPEDVDIFTLDPVTALKWLCGSIDTLVHLTGDVPPTPPVRSRGHSPSPGPSALRNSSTETPKKENQPTAMSLMPPQSQPTHIDGVPFIKTPIGSPEAHASEPSHVIGAHAQPVHLQHGAIARKFYSKRPPPISTEDYLMRMHKYCPMSTAVYLATSRYITRMAVTDRILPVTPRNVHRLLLAGLRVAMKALEDLSWPHARFSKVGGVSEGELGRLEITFCFLMDFSLKVDEAMLRHEAEALARQSSDGSWANGNDAVLGSPVSPMELRIPESRKGGEKRKASSVLPSRPVVNAAAASGGIEVIGH